MQPDRPVDARSSPSSFDVIIVGGGHNGLVAAGLLAREGLSVCVCEARELVGGAAISEHPFGPDHTVSTLSYVVSLLPPSIVTALDLPRHGYHVFPQGPYVAPRRDGRALILWDDPRRRAEAIAAFHPADAPAHQAWERDMGRLGRLLAPLLGDIPPTLGSRRPADLARQAWMLRRLAGIDARAAVDLARLASSSVADLVEPRFASDALRGVLSVSGVIGTWGGPRSPGTGYVMLHHHLGGVEDGPSGPAQNPTGSWGFPRGGMGAVSSALAAAARSFGARIRTSAPVARIEVRAGGGGPQVQGVLLQDGTRLAAPIVVTTAHPQISFLRLVERSHLPADFVADIEGWHTRSGTVKVNLVVDRLPTLAAHPEFDPRVYGGTIVLAESLDDVEGAFTDAAAGRAAELPFADVCIPSVLDDSLAPPGQHVVSMFTQWVPHTWAGADSPAGHAAELDSYADRVVARLDAVAPGLTDSVLHRQVIGPWQLEHDHHLIGGNIFHGELTLGQMFHARPAAGYADLRTPVRGLYQAGSGTHGGGGVTGIPGRNVVRQILTDRRRARWRRRWAGSR